MAGRRLSFRALKSSEPPPNTSPPGAWRAAGCAPSRGLADGQRRRTVAARVRGGDGKAETAPPGGRGRNAETPAHRAGVLYGASGGVLLSHGECHTIIGAKAFHGPVRDGKAWDHLAMATRHKLYKLKEARTRLSDRFAYIRYLTYVAHPLSCVSVSQATQMIGSSLTSN